MAKKKVKNIDYVDVVIYSGLYANLVKVECLKRLTYRGFNLAVIKSQTKEDRQISGKYSVIETTTGLTASMKKDYYYSDPKFSMATKHKFIELPSSIDKVIDNAKYNIDCFLFTGKSAQQLIKEAKLSVDGRLIKTDKTESLFIKLKKLGI